MKKENIYSLVVASRDGGFKQTQELVLSINNQTENFSVIIIDGGNSKQIIELFLTINKNTTMIKSPPKGIYNAYNFGIQNIDGGFVSFMGVDDKFYSETSVEDFISLQKKTNEKVFLLNSFLIITENYLKKFPVFFKLEKLFFRWTAMMHHQGLIVDVTLLKQNFFQEEHILFADQIQLQNLISTEKIKYYDTNFVKSNLGGISTLKSSKSTRFTSGYCYDSIFSSIVYKFFWVFR